MNNLVYVNKNGEMCGDLALDRRGYFKGYITSTECGKVDADGKRVRSRVYRFPKFTQEDEDEIYAKHGSHTSSKKAKQLRQLGYKVKYARKPTYPPLPKFNPS